MLEEWKISVAGLCEGCGVLGIIHTLRNPISEKNVSKINMAGRRWKRGQLQISPLDASHVSELDATCQAGNKLEISRIGQAMHVSRDFRVQRGWDQESTYKSTSHVYVHTSKASAILPDELG